MKKNIWISLILAFLMICLTACDIRQIGDDDGEPDEPVIVPKIAIKMDNKNGNIQNEDDTFEVLFTATLTSITEAPSWYVNQNQMQSGSETFSYKPAFAGSYQVYCQAGNVISNKITITVSAKAFSLKISADSESSTIVQYKGSVQPIVFNSQIDGVYVEGIDYTADDIKWCVDDVEASTGKSFTFTPDDDFQKNRIVAKYKDGLRHISNFYDVVVKLADVVVDVTGSLSQPADDIAPVEFFARAVNNIEIGNMNWYINDSAQAAFTGARFSFAPSESGVYKVQGAVVVSETTIYTKAEYLVAGHRVSTVAEFNDALRNDSVDAIFIENDLTFSAVTSNSHIGITRSVSIAGNGKTLYSTILPDTFINISADNVCLRDLTIVGAGKYNVQFYNCSGGYLDNVYLVSSGYAALHLNRARAAINNIFVEETNYAAIELSQPAFDDPKNENDKLPSILTILGRIVYETETFLPIYSSNSQSACIVVSEDFTEFIVTLDVGSSKYIIRRWCNDGCNLGWKISPPAKVSYKQGEALDLRGIALRVDMCSESMNFDESYITMLLESSIGQDLASSSAIRLEIYDANNEFLRTYYMIGAGNAYAYVDEDGNLADATLYSQDARVKLFISDIYIGAFSIQVV